MRKILEGVVVSLKMQKTAVVQVARVAPHPIYKKLIKRDKKIKADTSSFDLSIGDRLKIGQTRPLSAQKHFKILEVLKK